MFTERQLKIIAALKQREGGITGDEIARLCGVSSKTIRTDMKNIAAALDKNIAEIKISKRQGYSLAVYDAAGLDYILSANDGNAADGSKRAGQILAELLEAALLGVALRQQDLADGLFIGLSTFKTDLRAVKTELAKYDLSIVNFKNHGMMLDGGERDMRRCVFEHLFRAPIHRTRILQKFSALPDTGKLRSIIIRVTSAYDVVLMDESLERLTDYVFITLIRAKANHNVGYMLQESKSIEAHNEFAMASAIFEELWNDFGVDVMTSEIYYVAQHLIGSKKYTPAESGISRRGQELTDRIIARIKSLVGMDFGGDETLIGGLKTHLEAVIPRIRFRTRIKNDVLNVVKNEYPLAFQIGVIAGKVIEEAENIAVSEDEIGFLAVHFGAALTRMNVKTDQSTQTACIVCGSGIGTAVLLKARVEEYFKGIIAVSMIIPGYKLQSAPLEGIDIVISTIPRDKLPPLAEKDADKIIVVRHFLDENEVKIIQQKLLQTTRIFAQNVERFFLRECFVTDKNAISKEAILKEMTDGLVRLGLMDDEARRSVFEREEASPTEIGNLVAIPHPMINNAAVSSISVMVLKKPMMWVEHQVQVVFLLSIAKTEFYLWEPIFLKLFKYLVKENGVKRIIAEPDYDTFIRDFKKSF